MRARFCAAALLGSAVYVSLNAQQPRFDVASVRQNKTADRARVDLRPTPTSLTVVNLPLRTVISQAYALPDYVIIGGPEWLRIDRWDIVAKSEVAGDDDLTRSKLKSLLAERFQLVTRMEKRDLQSYVVSLLREDGRLGDKLRRPTVDCAAMAKGRDSGAPSPPLPPGEPPCGFSMIPGPGSLSVRGRAQFSNFVILLGQVVGTQIVDKTGLNGVYGFDLTFGPDAAIRAGVDSGAVPGGAAVQPVADVPSLSTAMQDQLGLKLHSMTVATDVLVIDSIARPTED